MIFSILSFSSLMIEQQSSLSEKWATTCSKVGAVSSSSTSSSHEGGVYKYVVYKEPLSLDRFYIHDVTAQEGAGKSHLTIFILSSLIFFSFFSHSYVPCSRSFMKRAT